MDGHSTWLTGGWHAARPKPSLVRLMPRRKLTEPSQAELTEEMREVATSIGSAGWQAHDQKFIDQVMANVRRMNALVARIRRLQIKQTAPFLFPKD